MVWVCVQAGNTDFNDNLKQYDGIELIVDWPLRAQQTLTALQPYHTPIKLWRFTTDPTTDRSFPRFYSDRCPYAVFANEPDVEGAYPAWYKHAYDLWRAVGGKVVSPAYSDQGESPKRFTDGYVYDVLGVHCYSGNFANHRYALATGLAIPIWITEYAHQGQQERCLQELGDLQSVAALFTWEWLAPGNRPGFDLKNVVLLSEQSVKDKRVFIVQAGHQNTENNCDASLRGETGAQGECERNIAIGTALVAKLMDAGITARLVDANFNCAPDCALDYQGVLALHCQSNPPNESGWDIGVGNPAADGAADKSAALALNVAAQYEAATGLQRRSWCQGNPNVQEYYLFNSLSKATPFALIEMGNADLDHTYLVENEYRVVDGLLNGILAFLGRSTLPVPTTAEATPVERQPEPTPAPMFAPPQVEAAKKAIAFLEQAIQELQTIK